MKHKSLKKAITFVLALAISTAIFTGCGDSSPSQSASSEAPSASGSDGSADSGTGTDSTLSSPVSLTFATQDVGTAMYMYASSIANVWTPALPAGSNVDVTTTSPGGVGAPIIVENGDCDITLGNAAPAKWAVEDGLLGNPPTQNVRAIAGGLGKDFVNVLFTQSFVDRTGITTVEELIEQQYPVRIAIKANGAFGELACSKVLEALGVDYDTINSWGGSVTQTGSDAIVSLLKDDRADMTIDHLGAGQSATTELCMTAKMYFPQLSDDTLNKLKEAGFDDMEIPAGTWSGQTEAIKSVGSQQVLLCSANLPDDVVYVLTKALCEGKADLVNSNATLDAFDPETAYDPLKLGAPIHPGAEAYYREMGYMQ